jgi:hypothetical protein
MYPLTFGLTKNWEDVVKDRDTFKGRRPYDIVDNLTAPLVVHDPTSIEDGRVGFVEVASRLVNLSGLVAGDASLGAGSEAIV